MKMLVRELRRRQWNSRGKLSWKKREGVAYVTNLLESFLRSRIRMMQRICLFDVNLHLHF